MSQKQIILNILSDKNWHCTNEFYSSYMADPRKRISELKDKGYLLEWRWCQSHLHKKSKEWHLIEKSPILENLNKMSLKMLKELPKELPKELSLF